MKRKKDNPSPLQIEQRRKFVLYGGLCATEKRLIQLSHITKNLLCLKEIDNAIIFTHKAVDMARKGWL